MTPSLVGFFVVVNGFSGVGFHFGRIYGGHSETANSWISYHILAALLNNNNPTIQKLSTFNFQGVFLVTRDKVVVPPPCINHEWPFARGPTTGSLGDLRSPRLLTTYKSWDDPPSGSYRPFFSLL